MQAKLEAFKENVASVHASQPVEEELIARHEEKVCGVYHKYISVRDFVDSLSL
jgi:hypothetical protein